MAPEDVLSSVDESRREFLKKVIGGTVFAVPLMVSFSMDGLSLDEAEAVHISNQTNNAGAPFCSNLSYVGPKEFAAYLFSDETRVHARAHFKVSRDRLNYEFKLPNGVLFDSADILVPLAGAAGFSISWNGRVFLQEGKGAIDEETTLVNLCALNSLLEEMATGQVTVTLFTSGGDTLRGMIQPVY